MTVPRWWPWAFTISSVLVAALSLRALYSPMALTMEHMVHYLADHRIALYAHVILGPLALLILPFQFNTRLRMYRPSLHRWLGRVYAVSILGAGLGSLALLPGFEGSIFAATGFAVLAIAWIGSTALAVMAARDGDFEDHRRWMIRSATLTFAAVTLRVIMAPLMAAGWTITETYDVTAWGSWVPFLIYMEWRMRRTRRGRVAA